MSSDKEPRVIAYVGADTYVSGEGFRVYLVTEGQTGHRPTGDWPCDLSEGHRRPWFWGPSLKDAVAEMDTFNRRLGVEPDEALKIIVQSMKTQSEPKSESVLISRPVPITKPIKPSSKK